MNLYYLFHVVPIIAIYYWHICFAIIITTIITTTIHTEPATLRDCKPDIIFIIIDMLLFMKAYIIIIYFFE